MTSVYDALFDEDLPGFLCAKTQFWDKGQSDVEVYIRRRSIDGDWMWLVSRAVSHFSDAEISGIILEETFVPIAQMEVVQTVNRITRIMAILIQAVEAAWLTETKQNLEQSGETSNLLVASSANAVSMRSRLPKLRCG